MADAFERLRRRAGYANKRRFYEAINERLGTNHSEAVFSKWLSPVADDEHPQPRAVILLAAFELAGGLLPEPTEEEAKFAALEREVREQRQRILELERKTGQTH